MSSTRHLVAMRSQARRRAAASWCRHCATELVLLLTGYLAKMSQGRGRHALLCGLHRLTAPSSCVHALSWQTFVSGREPSSPSQGYSKSSRRREEGRGAGAVHIMSGAPATPKPFSFKPGAGSAPSSPLGRSSPSASAPTSRKVSGTTTTKSSRAAAVVEPPEPLLGRSEEGSIHRQVRTLLLDHRKARLAWEQTATYDGLKAVRTWIQADEDVK